LRRVDQCRTRQAIIDARKALSAHMDLLVSGDTATPSEKLWSSYAYVEAARFQPQQYASALLVLGFCLRESELYDDATRALDEAHCVTGALAARGEDVGVLNGDILRQLGKVASCTKRYDNAKQYFGEAFEVYRSRNVSTRDMPDLLVDIGKLQFTMGATKLAKTTITMASKLYRSHDPNGIDVLSCLELLAAVSRSLEEATPAFEHLRAECVTRYGADSLQVAYRDLSFALFLQRHGRHQMVVNICERALPVVEKETGADSLMVAKVLQQLCTSLLILGRDCKHPEFKSLVATRARCERQYWNQQHEMIDFQPHNQHPIASLHNQLFELKFDQMHQRYRYCCCICSQLADNACKLSTMLLSTTVDTSKTSI